jgi:PAB-dependent poly(A)-specific ribonuclease subunit 3
VFVYTYHANSQTLFEVHLKNKPGRGAALIAERTIWSYIIQIAGAIKAAHDAGLAVRMVDVSKVLLTGANRVRVSACGVADVLTYNPALVGAPGVVGTLQQEDITMFGKLVFALCCGHAGAVGASFGKSLEFVQKHYSPDLKAVALFMLSPPQAHQQKHIGMVFDMLGSRLLTEIDDLQKWVSSSHAVASLADEPALPQRHGPP